MNYKGNNSCYLRFSQTRAIPNKKNWQIKHTRWSPNANPVADPCLHWIWLHKCHSRWPSQRQRARMWCPWSPMRLAPSLTLLMCIVWRSLSRREPHPTRTLKAPPLVTSMTLCATMPHTRTSERACRVADPGVRRAVESTGSWRPHHHSNRYGHSQLTRIRKIMD
jgi:hypothetical protein